MLLKKNSIFWKDTNEEQKLLEAKILYHEVKKCPKLSHVLITFEGYEDHLLYYQVLVAHKRKSGTTISVRSFTSNQNGCNLMERLKFVTFSSL